MSSEKKNKKLKKKLIYPIKLMSYFLGKLIFLNSIQMNLLHLSKISLHPTFKNDSSKP